MSALRWEDGYLVPEPEPTPAQKAWRRTTGATEVLRAVEARLVASGAITELRQFHGLSAQEIDVLLWLEREAQTEAQEIAGCAPSTPQDGRAEVAA